MGVYASFAKWRSRLFIRPERSTVCRLAFPTLNLLFLEVCCPLIARIATAILSDRLDLSSYRTRCLKLTLIIAIIFRLFVTVPASRAGAISGLGVGGYLF